MLSPMWPEKNMTMLYEARNATSVWPSSILPSGPLKGAHPRSPSALCSSVGFSTDLTMDGGLRLAWYIM